MSGHSTTYNIALTEDKLYKVAVPLGQGSFSIGTAGLSQGKYDVWAEKESKINWDAFNGYYTGAGERNRACYPYGTGRVSFTIPVTTAALSNGRTRGK